MKRIACILIAILIPLVCSGDGWYFSSGAGGGGITISYESYTSKTYTGSSFGSIDAPSGTTAGDL